MKFIRTLLSGVTALAMACSITTALPEQTSTISAEAATTNYSFDLGATAQSGFTSVSASTAYSSSLGYGFRNTAGVKDVAAAGSGALSDAVQFTDTTNTANTFDVDLPNGLYQVTVTLGNTTRTSVYMENMLQIVNMTGNNATDSIQIPVTDGQLNIRAAAGKEGYPFSISEIDITYLSADATMPKTIWFCGDSTVCNYYPKDTSTQAGWGQVFNQYIDSSWNVRDMAASGQYAKGFVDAGQFDAIEYYGKKGDVYIISIGINDTNYSNATEYYETVTDMVQRAKAKGMTVILVKQQGRCSDVTNHPTLTGRWFGSTLDTIGTEQDVQVIDLFNLFFDYCKSIGQDATTALYMTGDDLHPNRQGALILAEMASKQIDLDSINLEEGATIDESQTYLLQNVNSGKYLAVEGTATNGGNVSQSDCTSMTDNYLWTVKADSNGYYYIYSQAETKDYLLDLSFGNTANGTNIGIYQNTNADAQLFKFLSNSDGSYCIATKSSKDQSVVEVKDALTDNGANVQEWERNSHNCQSWKLIPVTKGETQEWATLGDLNQDGVVNGFDLTLLKQSVQNNSATHTQKIHGDTNADGTLNNTDTAILENYIYNNTAMDSVTNQEAIFYAEDASYAQGITETTNTGFCDSSYINLDNTTGSFLEWNITVPTAGNYFCSFSIANGSTVNRQMQIIVNNGENYWLQDFLSTDSWTSWTTRGIVLPLVAGVNTIRMNSATDSGGPNIDTMKISLTEEPVAEYYIPETTTTDDTSTTTTNHTIYIAGDSTAQTYRASYAPQQGWGAYLQNYVSEGYTVSNHAIAGRSSKSFYDNGRLDTILSEMQAGDYLLIQFGINDSASSIAERYAPVSGSVPGTDGSFEYYIAKYIEGALAKGGTPVLVSPTLGLKAYNSTTKQFNGSYSNYASAMQQLANYYNIPYIDLNSQMVTWYNSVGYDTAYTYHLISTELSTTDMTHFTETGADVVAKLVGTSLNSYLK